MFDDDIARWTDMIMEAVDKGSNKGTRDLRWRLEFRPSEASTVIELPS